MDQKKADLFYESFGSNIGYVLELYALYKQDPQLVDADTRAVFKHWQPPVETAEKPAVGLKLQNIVGAANLARAIRDYGHLAAHLDPLGTKPLGDPSLEISTYGLTDQDLLHLPASLVGGPVAETGANASEAIKTLRSIYSSTTGYDYGHIHRPEERRWLREAAELRRFRPAQVSFDPLALLERLTEVEGFELFLQRVFPGKFRFSLEGLDMLAPMLDEIIIAASAAGISSALLGMGHRGRLNVLVQVLHRRFDEILAEFMDPVEGRSFPDELGWTGDVKYHIGASRAVRKGMPVTLTLTLAPNPSHVEAINPVVEGMARAAGSAINQAGTPRFDSSLTLPILIHGDAAFTGQGVVAETLNLSRVPGYNTGGTIHIIANNQLGFTTSPESMRSTLYASDPAKGFEIPIVHVNADDPEACIEAARMAFAYRAEFRKDFLIDLIGYRRRGHNEGDEPAFTQPLLYKQIQGHATVRELWARTLFSRKLTDQNYGQELLRRRMETLQQVLDSLQPEQALAEPVPEPPPRGAAKQIATAVARERLITLSSRLLQIPSDVSLHPKIQRAMERRKHALEETGIVDWSMAEDLAFASILEDGIAIRLTGEDSERGTFSQRHSVFHDTKTGTKFIPLQLLPQAKAAFEVRNSPLSENAAIGFEYGYCIQKREQLVIWEAQYGDFVNGAQVMLDEFLVSGRAKWGQAPSLVLLLPHGYEGQGPNHSSAHVERLLQLAVDQNIRIANCTTAAQYFHLLRRQALLLEIDPLPLFILTPKSLLRHPRVSSALQELAAGGWQPVIDYALAPRDRDRVRDLIVCNGKAFVDLVSDKRSKASPHLAIACVEQLYPYPSEELESLLGRYPNLEKVCWVQEEPENMGAWGYLQPLLRQQLRGRWPLGYIGRPPSSSPAEGSSARHAITQKAIMDQAYSPGSALVDSEIAWMEKRDPFR